MEQQSKLTRQLRASEACPLTPDAGRLIDLRQVVKVYETPAGPRLAITSQEPQGGEYVRLGTIHVR